jgi:hypothetical protein
MRTTTKMRAVIKGKELVIAIPLLEKPRLSASGKNVLVCTSGGVKTLSVKVNGQPIRIVLNAFIPPNAPTSVTKNNEDQETPDEDDDEE